MFYYVNQRVVGIIVLFTFLFIPFASAQNSTFGVGPVYNNDKYPGWFVYELKPGKSFEDEFLIESSSSSPLNLRVYMQDAANVSKDQKTFAVFEENKTPADKQFLSKWVTLEKNAVTLDPHESRILKLKITVPLDAKKQEYAGVIFAHLDPQAQDIQAMKGNTSTTQLGVRVGIRMYVNVTDHPIMPNRYRPVPSGRTISQYTFVFLAIIGFFGGGYAIFSEDIKKLFKRKH